MEPLQAIPMPTHGVLVGLTTANTWQTGTAEEPVYFAYVATNSTQSLSFVSLQVAARPSTVLRLASRRSFVSEYQYGVVIEVYLSQKMEEGEAIFLSLAQSGATTYFPPQPIED